MLFQFAPIILVYALVAVLMLYLSGRTWALRPARGATIWSLTMLFLVIHTIGTCLEIAFVVPALKLAMNRVIYFGITGFTFFWGVFAIQYSNKDRWLNRYSLALLAVMPLIILCLALFAEQHQLLYRQYEFVYIDGLLLGQVVAYGPMFWIWLGYSYLVVISSWLLLLHSAIQSHAIFRNQTRLVIVASGTPLLVYTAQIAGMNPIAPFSPLVFAMAFSGVLMLIAMTRYRFMDIIPVAHDLIFRNVKSGIILLDLKGRVAGMNRQAEQITGRTEKQVLGLLTLDAFPHQQHIVKQFQGVMEIKTEVAITETGPYYELQITPLYSNHSELSGQLIMLYDITERKQVERQTVELTLERERVRLLQQFISQMSHDLRTPLANMKVSQYLLRKELAGQHADRLESLENQTDRLTEMVESMLTLLRLEEEEVDNQLAVDVNELVGYAMVRNQKLADERGSQLQFNPANDSTQVLANSEELSLAISNLIVNAIHSAPNGEIKISTVRDGSWVVVRVCDSGVGIANDDLMHIFERFYRVDSARGTQNGGLGLGLTIAKTIVERHAGSIEVHSRLGEGSEFSIRLPAANAGESTL